MDVMHSGRESTRDSSVLRSWGELWGTGTQWRLVGLKGKGEQCTVLPVAGPKVRSAQRSVPPARMPSSHLLNPDTSRTARGLREESLPSIAIVTHSVSALSRLPERASVIEVCWARNICTCHARKAVASAGIGGSTSSTGSAGRSASLFCSMVVSVDTQSV